MGAWVELIVRHLATRINKFGYEPAPVVMKSDQDLPILDFAKKVARNTTAQTFIETSPVGSSQSNGIVERIIQSVEDQMRVMKVAVGARIRATTDSSSDIVPWLFEYSSVLLHRYGLRS